MPDALLSWPVGAPSALMPVLSIVVPVFNEADGIRAFHCRLMKAVSPLGTAEVIYVDDGSTDDTRRALMAIRAGDSRAAVVSLSRNFGKEIATTAGMDHARGEAVVVIDADLQDPPELIPELFRAWRNGAEMAFAQRRARDSDGWLKRVTARAFYRAMQHTGRVKLPQDVGDFRLMSRPVVDAVLQLREQHRFMKGLFAWVGFRTVAVPYDRAPRLAGHSKWSYWRLWNLAIEGVTGFTVMPLKLATYLGIMVAVAAVTYAAVVVIKTLIVGNTVAGYPSLMAVTLFLGGVQLMTLGVIGEYLGRVFNETKRRPLYLVSSYLPSAQEPACP